MGGGGEGRWQSRVRQVKGLGRGVNGGRGEQRGGEGESKVVG